jgi:hypothetical protein
VFKDVKSAIKYGWLPKSLFEAQLHNRSLSLSLYRVDFNGEVCGKSTNGKEI